MKRLLIPLFALVSHGGAAETTALAAEGRVWLKVPAGQPPLGELRVSRGSATPAPWEKDPAARERHSDILFPIRWWSWTEVEIGFTPAADGTVDLSLTGPWAAGGDDAPVRQEVLWDNLEASGTELLNGGFETPGDGAPASWKTPWSPYPAAGEWPLAGAAPLAGSRLAASWQNRPLTQTLRVSAGRPVRIKLHAMAATPPDFTPPKRLGADTPAHRALARLKRGVNLGNGWEAQPHTWGLRFTTEDIDRIADQGFDHIRVPVAWHYHLQQTDKGTVISPALLAELEPVLRRAMERKLHVLLNWHHFNDLTSDPDKHLGRFVSGWQAIAEHFQSWPPELFFELLNEPCDALSTETCAAVYQKTITALRRSNPRRAIVVSPGRWGQVSELDRLRLPDDDDRLIVTVHCYEPFHFTHQGAGWVGLQDFRGISYPGPPEQPFSLPPSLKENSGARAFVEGYNSQPASTNPSSARGVRQTLDAAREWSRHFGRPIHLGEFGAHHAGDDASRKRYLRDVRTLAEERGIPWTLWEWKAGFGYWDPENKRARFRASLFE